MQTKELAIEQFPPLLLEINDPPKKLYTRGNIPHGENLKFLTVVGTRKPTRYGHTIVKRLISNLRGHNIVIVSGLAYGIDKVAHESAIENNLRTVAIPGSGLDDSVLYPRANLNLAKNILDNNGCLLSEYAPDFRATQWSFPRRNRIMAGFSHATLVVEAEKKSGSLITTKLATEYNREVMAVPGPIDSTLSEGPNMLIRLGATPITSSDDILESFGIKVGVLGEIMPDDCSPDELYLLTTLQAPLTRDEIVEILKWPVSRINITISSLELKSHIKEEIGRIFRI